MRHLPRGTSSIDIKELTKNHAIFEANTNSAGAGYAVYIPKYIYQTLGIAKNGRVLVVIKRAKKR